MPCGGTTSREEEHLHEAFELAGHGPWWADLVQGYDPEGPHPDAQPVSAEAAESTYVNWSTTTRAQAKVRGQSLFSETMVTVERVPRTRLHRFRTPYVRTRGTRKDANYYAGTRKDLQDLSPEEQAYDEDQRNTGKAKITHDYIQEHARLVFDVSIDDLRARSCAQSQWDSAWENGKPIVAGKDKTTGNPLPIIENSCAMYDRNGKWMMTYASRHIDPKTKEVVYDGINPRELYQFRVATQNQFHLDPKVVPLGVDTKRHAVDAKYPLHRVVYTDKGLENLSEEERAKKTAVRVECKGVRHDTPSWKQKGHDNTIRRASTDLRGKSREDMIGNVERMYHDKNMANHIGHLTRLSCPKQYERMKNATTRADWIQALKELEMDKDTKIANDEGFILRVTLYKVQTGLHRDIQDFLCAITCAGEYEEGYAIFPDLGIRLRYRPGDIIIFYSDALWHMVSPWKATPQEPGSLFMPGRISRVYATHKDLIECMEKPNWWKYLHNEADPARNRTE